MVREWTSDPTFGAAQLIGVEMQRPGGSRVGHPYKYLGHQHLRGANLAGACLGSGQSDALARGPFGWRVITVEDWAEIRRLYRSENLRRPRSQGGWACREHRGQEVCSRSCGAGAGG